MKEENDQNCYNILKTTILMENLKFTDHLAKYHHLC
jgi:hypothetical protein